MLRDDAARDFVRRDRERVPLLAVRPEPDFERVLPAAAADRLAERPVTERALDLAERLATERALDLAKDLEPERVARLFDLAAEPERVERPLDLFAAPERRERVDDATRDLVSAESVDSVGFVFSLVSMMASASK